MELLLTTLRIIGCTLWGAGLWASAVVAREHTKALTLGTSLRKFRTLHRSLFRELVLPGALLYLGCELAALANGNAPRPVALHALAAVAVGALTTVAASTVSAIHADLAHGSAANRLSLLRPASLPVLIGGILLEVWPLL